jgi:hypothetical protein
MDHTRVGSSRPIVPAVRPFPQFMHMEIVRFTMQRRNSNLLTAGNPSACEQQIELTHLEKGPFPFLAERDRNPGVANKSWLAGSQAHRAVPGGTVFPPDAIGRVGGGPHGASDCVLEAPAHRA